MDGQLKENVNNFLKYNAIWIAVSIVVLILITILVLLIVNRNKKSKRNVTPSISLDEDEWSKALGGNDNIIDAKAVGSRLTLILKDDSLIDSDSLKKLGVQSIMKMSNKLILVVEKQADLLLSKIIKK